MQDNLEVKVHNACTVQFV